MAMLVLDWRKLKILNQTEVKLADSIPVCMPHCMHNISQENLQALEILQEQIFEPQIDSEKVVLPKGDIGLLLDGKIVLGQYNAEVEEDLGEWLYRFHPWNFSYRFIVLGLGQDYTVHLKYKNTSREKVSWNVSIELTLGLHLENIELFLNSWLFPIPKMTLHQVQSFLSERLEERGFRSILSMFGIVALKGNKLYRTRTEDWIQSVLQEEVQQRSLLWKNCKIVWDFQNYYVEKTNVTEPLPTKSTRNTGRYNKNSESEEESQQDILVRIEKRYKYFQKNALSQNILEMRNFLKSKETSTENKNKNHETENKNKNHDNIVKS
ncbi:MAG TPA: hypothetical protein PLR86_08245 [Planctomycetota bacterium]|nr:hypothetical protein [Planctomycetota bacterium]